MGTAVVVDFDGTITEADTVDVLAEHWDAPRSEAALALLAEGRISARDALARQLSGVRFEEEAALKFLLSRSSPRRGLGAMVDSCRRRGWDVLVVSDGIAIFVRSFLAAHGVDVAVHAHEVRFSPGGAEVVREELPVCGVCGFECKRPRLLELVPASSVVYVGDGASDRCAARGANVIFARDHLAADLRADGIPFHSFDDLGEVAERISRLPKPVGKYPVPSVA